MDTQKFFQVEFYLIGRTYIGGGACIYLSICWSEKGLFLRIDMLESAFLVNIAYLKNGSIK